MFASFSTKPTAKLTAGLPSYISSCEVSGRIKSCTVCTTQPSIPSSHKNLINYGYTKKCNAGACKSFETNQR